MLGREVVVVVSVRPHMGVFALYVGLTVSGYNLARVNSGSPEEDLIKAIKQADWPPAVRNYFANARSRTGGEKPYLPRAGMILEACFYLETGKHSKKHQWHC